MAHESMGQITRVGRDDMDIRVPTGLDCTVCPGKKYCVFQGPDSAYRTITVPHQAGYRAGDCVYVDDPDIRLGVAVLVLVVFPVVLVASGYSLLDCCLTFPYVTLVLWILGSVCWISGLVATDRWMKKSGRFRTKIRPSRR